MHKTKIEWADATWNPITGCLHQCPYCYAERMTKRFSGDVRLNIAETDLYTVHETDANLRILENKFPARNGQALAYPFGFAPTFHKYRLGDLDKWKQGVNIFVCSMADLFGKWVPTEWILEIFEECKKYPQHNYLFLTKNQYRLYELESQGKLPRQDNMWYGTTMTHDCTDIFFRVEGYHCFLSIEPILEDLGEINGITGLDWVITGAESGNRKDKVVPEKEWIVRLSEHCKKEGIPFFMKDSLEELMGEDFKTEMPSILQKKRPSKKHSANCMECGGNFRKSDMTYILTRQGKERGAKSRGSICMECWKERAEAWGLDE